MKKLLLTGALLLSLCIASFAQEDCHTISTSCGYFSGTAHECGEFVEMCLDSK